MSEILETLYYASRFLANSTWFISRRLMPCQMPNHNLVGSFPCLMLVIVPSMILPRQLLKSRDVLNPFFLSTDSGSSLPPINYCFPSSGPFIRSYHDKLEPGNKNGSI